MVEFETDISRMNIVIEENGCTLFGQLLGYPVVYWFDRERGYSLDAVELICYTVTVRNRIVEAPSDSGHKICSALLNIEQVWTTIMHSWYGITSSLGSTQCFNNGQGLGTRLGIGNRMQAQSIMTGQLIHYSLICRTTSCSPSLFPSVCTVPCVKQ